MISCDAVVVGAGAAGMFAAGILAEHGLATVLLEKMPQSGNKLRLTGKGRCNLTNACDRETLLRQYPRGGKFLYSAVSRFSSEDTVSFFEGRGIPLKVERGNRVFPVSDRAEDIRRALAAYAESAGAVLRQERALRLLLRGNRVTGVLTDRTELSANAVLLATGGMSYPQTGSDGDGYRMAAKAGHTVIPPRPSLIPIVTAEDFCREATGLSLRNVTLTVKDQKGKTVFSELGELLFTHFGVSGPLVLSASAVMQAGKPSDYRLLIDCKPGLTPEQLDARLLRDLSEHGGKTMLRLLPLLLPRKLIPPVLRLADIPPERRADQITREERRRLGQTVKALPLTPVAFRPIEEAIVTCGGVALPEVDPKTMASKKAEGLFFAGELLDIDGYTGGFNLQAAFSTAYAAAFGILSRREGN